MVLRSAVFLTLFLTLAPIAGNCATYTIDRRQYVSDEEQCNLPYSEVGQISTAPGNAALVHDGFSAFPNVISNLEFPFTVTSPRCETDSGRVLAVNDWIDSWGCDYNPDCKWQLADNTFSASVIRKYEDVEDLDVEVVGFSKLRIISDEEIGALREAYAKYLLARKDAYKYKAGEFGLAKDVNSKNFLQVMEEYGFFDSGLLTDHNRMKTSKCKISVRNGKIYNSKTLPCQSWGGIALIFQKSWPSNVWNFIGATQTSYADLLNEKGFYGMMATADLWDREATNLSQKDKWRVVYETKGWPHCGPLYSQYEQ